MRWKHGIKQGIRRVYFRTAIRYMPKASYESPYEGAKEMLLMDEVDNKDFLIGLVQAM